MSKTPKNKDIKHVHFIGICGVGMSAVASALFQKGFKVTGSDAGFFPPVSTHLSNLGIPYYAGFHPEKMIENGAPNLVVVGNATASKNPEFEYVKEHGIPFKSYPEALGEFLIKPHSIVVSGTYGKTTSSAVLSHILKEASFNPSYMIGGVPNDGSPGAIIGQGDWSVVEGDEYTTAKWDKRPKFAHYKPTHLVLTAVKWDHADVYETEKSYFDAFRMLIKSVPESGLIVACTDTETLPKLLAEAKRKYTSYGRNKDADYKYENVIESKEGISFDIINGKKKYGIQSRLLGAYNAENLTACFALSKEAGIDEEKIIKAIASFQGMKRRLEKRLDGDVTVIDDIAHSPEKARSALMNIRSIWNGLIVAVYEPNTGNRTPQSKPEYKDAFIAADTVVIPRLSKLKVDESNPEKTFDGPELAETIKEGGHRDVHYIDDDEELVKFITLGRNKGDAVVFLGSHGFRGMIEETIKSLGKKD